MKPKILIAMIILLLTSACTSNKKEDNSTNQNHDLENIKSGYLIDCPDFSIAELVNDYMENSNWKIEKNIKGDYLYNAYGQINEDGTLKDAVIRFKKDGKVISINNFEVNKISKNTQELVSDMCKISQEKKQQVEKEQWLKEENEKIKNIPEGYAIYRVKVSNATTYGNSIFPGDYVNLYCKTTNDFILKNVKVLQVLDKFNNHVFEPNIDEAREPSEIVILVKEEDLTQLNSLSDSLLLIPPSANFYK